jgi:hypothetical protein
MPSFAYSGNWEKGEEEEKALLVWSGRLKWHFLSVKLAERRVR